MASCPTGQNCMVNPLKAPGLAVADFPGVCMSLDGRPSCGGIAGVKCSSADQVCTTDPRASCDPILGGANCQGVCVTF